MWGFIAKQFITRTARAIVSGARAGVEDTRRAEQTRARLVCDHEWRIITPHHSDVYRSCDRCGAICDDV